jgi:hypothetical protein
MISKEMQCKLHTSSSSSSFIFLLTEPYRVHPTDVGSSDKQGHLAGLYYRMWQSVRLRALLYAGLGASGVRLGCLLCFAQWVQRGDAEQHSIYVLKKRGLACLNQQRITNADSITKVSAASLGNGWVYFIKYYMIVGTSPTVITIPAELAARVFFDRATEKKRLNIPAGSVLQIKNKKFKAQIGVKYDVGTARRDYDVTLGQAWSIEEHASHAMRLFCGQGYTTGKFVNPQFESKEAAMSRGRHVVMATKKEFGYNLFGYN